MKKDRNAFFSEYGFNNPGGTPNMMMPGGGHHSIHHSSGHLAHHSVHHSGAHHPGNEGHHNMPMPTDIDSRISKLERAINRLETRISKLENDGHTPFTEHDGHSNHSMYMV